MPIEFRCHRCQRLLRTADDSGGKQTKCPECGTILDIPLPAAEVPEPAPPTPAPPEFAPVSPFGAASLQPGTIDIGDLFNRTWEIFSKNVAQLVLGGLILFGLSLVMVIPFAVVLGIALAIAGALADKGNQALGAVIVIVAMAVFIFGALFASGWIYGGFLRWMLMVARGQPNSLGDIFAGGRYLLRFAGAGFLFFLAVSLGYLLCIVPGVLIALMFSQFAWLIVDKDAGAIESLSRSMQLTEGNKLQLFLLMLLVMVISGAANMVPFGFVFTTPFTMLLLAVTYLQMNGEVPTGAVPQVGR